MNIYRLFGESLSHSLSPEIHKEIYRYIGAEAAYSLFPFSPENLEQAIQGVRTLSIQGVNVTIPYKESVLPYLDTIDEHAKQMQAVNTIHHEDDKLVGYNTDYDGFGLIFDRRGWEITGKTAVVLGTGGAAKMAVYYLKQNGAKQIFVVSRSPEKYQSENRVHYIGYTELPNITGDFLINTTPVGMYPNTENTPVDESVIQSFDFLIDLIYNPYETRFLALGNSLNKQTANGMDMLIGQAVKSVEIWEDVTIDSKVTNQLIDQFSKRQDEH